MSDPNDGPIWAGTDTKFITEKPFTAFDGVTVVNPDNVVLTYVTPDGELHTNTWVNPTGDPEGVITNTSTGNFSATIDTTGKPGVWQFEWSSFASSGVDTTGTQTTWRGSKRVLPSLSDDY